jgi:hypothetical protein
VKASFCLLGIVVVLTAVSNAAGQATSAPWLPEADRAHFEELRENGFEALYNLDYLKARQNFSELERLFPQHPAGKQYLASSLWIETLYKTRRLQSSLYNSKSFYSNSEEKTDPKVIEQFRTWTRAAQKLAEARLKQAPQDTEALYFLGCTLGLKASFEEAVERRHFAALRDGSDAVDRHRQLIKLDPNYHDAEITIGLYDYVVGSLPLPAKLLAGITGAHGSKKRGLATIERVETQGREACDQAKNLLIVLYTREKRYGEAATLARGLAAKYPRNYLYRLEAADALVSQAALDRQTNHAGANGGDEAFGIFESLLNDKVVADTTARALDLIHFKYGEALLTAGKFEHAADEFLAAAKVESAEPGLATMAHLYAARCLDAANKREQALTQYRLVLSRPDVFESHDEAQKGLRGPFKVESAKSSLR